MKRLILMRHAKSSWDDVTLSDHDRPLNARGVGACATMADWLQENGFLPETVISSTATRCMETWERVGLAMKIDPPVTYVKRLYHAGSEQMLGVLHEARGDCVMMLGHNPGISSFAADLLGANRPDHPRFAYMPTAAIVVIDIDTSSFAQARMVSATCVEFTSQADVSA